VLAGVNCLNSKITIDESTSTLRLVARAVRPYIMFRPYTGHLWIDFLLLLLISALHFTILPTFLGKIVLVDLLTPWLLTYFISAPFKKSLAIGIVTALIVETHTSAPAGMYLSLYWVALVTLWLIRVSLSWRHTFPWVMTFAAGEIWIVFSEFFVHSVTLSAVSVTLTDLVEYLARIAFAVGAGMLFSSRVRREGVMEDNPL
jgi:hypothetical protein